MSLATRTARPQSSRRSPARPVRTLYPYQSTICNWLLGHLATNDLMLDAATGAGKTTLAMIAMWAAIRRGMMKHAIIIAPQTAIEDGFIPVEEVDYQAGQGDPEVMETIGPGEIRRATVGEDGKRTGTVDAVRWYLADPEPGYVLTTTHQAFALAIKDFLGDGFKDIPDGFFEGDVLLVDEAHHAGADRLGELVDAWSAAGGRLVYATATPYRTDGRPVKRDGMLMVRRTLAEQMEDGRFAPEHLAHSVVAVGQIGDPMTQREFEGRDLTSDEATQQQFIDRMAEDYAALGHPKLIVGVPILKGGSAGFVGRLIERFRQIDRPGGGKVRVLDGTGTTNAKKHEVLAALRAERTRNYADSQFDVIIGIQRVKEGFDWPHASTFFAVGIPPLQAVIQSLGRVMRVKGADHNTDHRNRGMIRFYVSGGGSLEGYDVAFSKHALAMVVALDNIELAPDLALCRLVKRSMGGGNGPDGGNPNGRGDEDQWPDLPPAPTLPIDVDTAVRATMVMTAAKAKEEGKHVTVGLLTDAAIEAHPEVDPDAIKRMVAGQIAVEPKVSAGFGEAMARRLKGRIGSKEVDRMLSEAVEEFRDQTLEELSMVAAVGRHFHDVAGVDLNKWMKSRYQKTQSNASLTDYDDVANNRIEQEEVVPIFGKSRIIRTAISINGKKIVNAGDILRKFGVSNVSSACKELLDQDKELIDVATSGGRQKSLFLTIDGALDLISSIRPRNKSCDRGNVRQLRRWLCNQADYINDSKPFLDQYNDSETVSNSNP